MLTVVDKGPCPVCGGSGWELSPTGSGVRQCVCKQEERIRKTLAASRIPERYRTATFESFEATNPSLQRALQTSRLWLRDFTAGSEGLLYLGPCGVGKTHLAIALLREVIQTGLRGYFYDMRDLLKEIQETYSPDSQNSELKILLPVIEADILVLDELGASIPSEWVRETLTYIVNRRYNERRVTIFTTNYFDKPSPGQPSLVDRIGARFRSRLHEMCKLVLIESEDYRDRIRDRRKP